MKIGDDVQVVVLGIKRGQVRIGVAAPKEVPVHREEVYDRIKHDGQAMDAYGVKPPLDDLGD